MGSVQNKRRTDSRLGHRSSQTREQCCHIGKDRGQCHHIRKLGASSVLTAALMTQP